MESQHLSADPLQSNQSRIWHIRPAYYFEWLTFECVVGLQDCPKSEQIWMVKGWHRIIPHAWEDNPEIVSDG